MSEEKISGRGPGAPIGKRPVEFICAAIANCTCDSSELIMESFSVSDHTPDAEKERLAALPKEHRDRKRPGLFPKEVAEKAFLDKHGQDPDSVIGPKAAYRAGKPNAGSKKRLTIDRDNIDNFTITQKCRNVIWGDWHGMVLMLEETDQKGLFSPISPVDSENKKGLIKGGIVEIADLQFVDENDEKIVVQQSE